MKNRSPLNAETSTLRAKRETKPFAVAFRWWVKQKAFRAQQERRSSGGSGQPRSGTPHLIDAVLCGTAGNREKICSPPVTLGHISGTTTKAANQPAGTEREPSLARSGYGRAGMPNQFEPARAFVR